MDIQAAHVLSQVKLEATMVQKKIQDNMKKILLRYGLHIIT